MSLFDCMAALASPSPFIDAVEAGQVAAELFGIVGKVRWLSGEKDRNFRITGAQGADFVLKISHPAEDGTAIACQNAAMLHVAVECPDLPTPRPLASRCGSHAPRHIFNDRLERHVRAFGWLPGVPLHELARNRAQSRSLGEALARLGRTLAGFSHPNDQPVLIWDLARAAELRRLVDWLPAERRDRVERALSEFEERCQSVLPGLRSQVVHNDLNPYNVLLGGDGADRVTGILDFGDLVRTQLVNDVAIAASYQIYGREPAPGLRAFLAGYESVTPLEREERELLPTLLAMRLAATLLITHWRAEIDRPNQAYILRNNAAAWHGLLSIEAASSDWADGQGPR